MPKSPKRKALFTSVKSETADKLTKIAEKYRVTVSDIVRWTLEDVVEGRYLPANLSRDA